MRWQVEGGNFAGHVEQLSPKERHGVANDHHNARASSRLRQRWSARKTVRSWPSG